MRNKNCIDFFVDKFKIHITTLMMNNAIKKQTKTTSIN